MTLLWRPLAYPTPIIGHPTPCIPLLHCRLIPFFMLPYCCTDRCSSGCFAWIVAVGVLPLCCCCLLLLLSQLVSVSSSSQHSSNLAAQCSECGSTEWRPHSDQATKMHTPWTKHRTQNREQKTARTALVCYRGQGGNPRLVVTRPFY